MNYITTCLLQVEHLKDVADAAKGGGFPEWVSQVLMYALFIGAGLKFFEAAKTWIKTKYDAEVMIQEAKCRFELEKNSSAERVILLEKNSNLVNKRIELIEHAISNNLVDKEEMKELLKDVKEDYDNVQKAVNQLYMDLFNYNKPKPNAN